jgi:UDP-N-acetyl-D-glucosamine/UDP-N-acetyl-D-galactosamine dehydrogenase
MTFNDKTVAVVGLGYVGLPLALAFGRVMSTIGFDVSESKITAYRRGVDPAGEMPAERFKQANQICFENDAAKLAQADFLVVAVPTPIDAAKRPDLSPVERACETVAKNLRKGAVVIFESTVYPGVTEEVCVPILEKISGLKNGLDFKVGYSPERINPGDTQHTLEKIIKVVSGQDQATLEQVAQLYEQVIEAGVHRASSIKVAEAAKVIENTQRDLNIALMNELAIIFNDMNIDTLEVLEAAGTKWNFLPFRPGLVGGHCIGVDPYYLTHKAQILGYNPEVILAGRRINDGMGKFIASETIKQMVGAGSNIKGARVLVMGLTFKENCSDIRNTKVVDVIRELKEYGVQVLVWDPVAEGAEAEREYGVQLVQMTDLSELDAVVAAVSHREILDYPLENLAQRCRKGAPFVDIKSAFSKSALQQAGFQVWRL